ncbi:MAG: translation initiation factor IF-2 [Azospirillaceae bacterium]
MSESKEQDRKTLSLGGKGRLSLGRQGGDSGQVRQSFSHGRSKTVQVEVKRKRNLDRHQTGLADGGAAARQAAEGGGAPRQGKGGGGKPTRGLTPAEREARERALKALKAEELSRPAPAPEAPPVIETVEAAEEPAASVVAEPEVLDPEALRRRELEELKSIQAEEDRKAAEERARIEEAEKAKSDSEAQRRRADADKREADAEEDKKRREVADRAAQAAVAKVGRGALEEEEQARARRAPGRTETPRRPAPSRGRGDQRRRSGKMTVTQALTGDEAERTRSLASVRRQRERERRAQAAGSQEKIVRDVTIPEALTVQELANRMAERAADVIKSLMKMGVMATITQSIDADTAELVVEEFGHRSKRVSEADVEVGLGGEDDATEALKPRAPIVTVMGHVDHGKTSLLDALRKTDVAAKEAGGITQHIGAYQVVLPSGGKITFIDTPGHAAFTAMRARGAGTTDIVILVVAADDSVMPQTIEAINHAKAAGVPMIIAINKCDLPASDPNKVRTELLQYEVVVEDMGGDVQAIEVSAKTGEGLDRLEEAILLQSEILELAANPDRTAEGVVVEAKIEKGRGAVATVLVRRGTLKVGDIFVTGAEWGRVRALVNDRGDNIQEAGPAVPVEVLGLTGAPLAGDDFVVVDSESRAREITDYRGRKKREQQQLATKRGTLEQMFAQAQAGETKELAVVIKGDVQGSVEAIQSSLEKLVENNDEVDVRVLHAAVGGITESDITLAASTGAMVIGFNVRAHPQAREMAKRDGVEIRYYSVIYEAIDDVRNALSGMLSPTVREQFIGYAQIREVFQITKVGKVGGCMITDGVVRRGAGVRLLRDDVVIHQGKLKTLKRFKDEVREVREGYECGMAFENYEDIKVGDVVECYETEEVARVL